jgi:hypothetical protein
VNQQTLLPNQQTLLPNQQTLLANQQTLLPNQQKPLQNQQTLLANQLTLLANQVTKERFLGKKYVCIYFAERGKISRGVVCQGWEDRRLPYAYREKCASICQKNLDLRHSGGYQNPTSSASSMIRKKYGKV